MCGRYTHLYTWRQLHRLMGLTTPEGDGPLELRAAYNTAPSQSAPIVRESADHERAASLARWGLVPAWSADPTKGVRPINARSEGVATSRMFRPALQRRRCLVPISGFYEWKREGKGKIPHYIRPIGGGILALAGLWERWGEGDAAVETFAILTTAANDMMRPLHDRMPVILDPDDFAAWLDPAPRAVEHAVTLLRPCASGLLEAFPVSTWVNSPSHDDERCVAPASDSARD